MKSQWRAVLFDKLQCRYKVRIVMWWNIDVTTNWLELYCVYRPSVLTSSSLDMHAIHVALHRRDFGTRDQEIQCQWKQGQKFKMAATTSEANVTDVL